MEYPGMCILQCNAEHWSNRDYVNANYKVRCILPNCKEMDTSADGSVKTCTKCWGAKDTKDFGSWKGNIGMKGIQTQRIKKDNPFILENKKCMMQCEEGYYSYYQYLVDSGQSIDEKNMQHNMCISVNCKTINLDTAMLPDECDSCFNSTDLIENQDFWPGKIFYPKRYFDLSEGFELNTEKKHCRLKCNSTSYNPNAMGTDWILDKCISFSCENYLYKPKDNSSWNEDYTGQCTTCNNYLFVYESLHKPVLIGFISIQLTKNTMIESNKINPYIKNIELLGLDTNEPFKKNK